MTTPIICRPPSFPIRRILDCPTEGRRRRMAGRDHGPYYGPTLTCLGCGDSWSCGELLERPFRRAWRKDEIAKAKRAWDEAGQYTSAEYADWLVAELAAVMVDVGSSAEDVPLPEEDLGPEIRIFRNPTGWIMTGSAPEGCTTNYHRQQDGRPPCTDTAVWKVVEEHTSADGYPMLTIGFYCDADLPAEHRPAA